MEKNEADVVVIGGGIAGCATAYYLAKRNAKVVLIEKGDIADEQSGRAWGFVRQQGRSPAEIPLMLACNRMWRELPAELNADVEWVQGGLLALAPDEQMMEEYRAWLQIGEEHGVDARLLSRKEIKDLIPPLEGDWPGGMYTASDGHAEPVKATTAFARAAQELGAQIYTSCPVEQVEVAAGQVTGVVTNRGTITAPVVVCAAGAWSAKLARGLGISLPQQAVRATVAETVPAPPITRVGLWAPDLGFRQRPDGSCYIAAGPIADYDVTLDSLRHWRLFLPNYMKNRGFFKVRVGSELLKDIARSLPRSPAKKRPFPVGVGEEPRPNQKSVERGMRSFSRMFPAHSGLGVQRVWAGRIDVTPDLLPVLGEVDQPKGFIFATGFSGHGFAMGPITGVLISELILDGKASLDLSPFRFSRFKEKDWEKDRGLI